MEVLELSHENYEATVSQEGIVLVDCWAAWCGACGVFAPIFGRAARRHSQHVFAKLDTEGHETLVKELGIEHIPSLLLYRDGILLFKNPGSVDEAGLDDIVRQAESLDMSEVRAHLAAEQGDSGQAP
jgi:thioredoxin 1